MSTKRLIVATGNAGKLREIKAILTDYEVLGAKEAGFISDPEENGSTFRENAAIKAHALYELAHCAVLADDSGLCVDALDGAPGIYSARFAGDHPTDSENTQKLLQVMKDIPEEERTARFKSAVCFISENGEEIYGEGSCEGRILFAPEGDGGFGYDPVFYSLDFNKSFGLLTADEKNAISHRKRALEDLRKKL
ncbi:MAG: RdgB/HAM1 family non-canonical purine NTP pyrophosphatase [Clostridia bacterium]|nr:RdgB/HAM1 family non-canonical purine NTP pyrophosphatase [Clostridia bacterium]